MQKLPILLFIYTGISLNSMEESCRIKILKLQLQQEWQELQKIKQHPLAGQLVIQYQELIVSALEEELKEILAIPKNHRASK